MKPFYRVVNQVDIDNEVSAISRLKALETNQGRNPNIVTYYGFGMLDHRYGILQRYFSV
jgi:hypothetical protein